MDDYYFGYISTRFHEWDLYDYIVPNSAKFAVGYQEEEVNSMKKHWLVGGKKFESYEEAEKQAKKYTVPGAYTGAGGDVGIYELVAYAEQVLPTTNVVKVSA